MPIKTPITTYLTQLFSRRSTNESSSKNDETKPSPRRENTVSVNQLHETLRKIVESQPERIAQESEKLKNERKVRRDNYGLGRHEQKTGLENVDRENGICNEHEEIVTAKRAKRFYLTKAAARFRELDLLLGAEKMNVGNGTGTLVCVNRASDLDRRERCDDFVKQNEEVIAKSVLSEKVESTLEASMLVPKEAMSVHCGEFSPRDIRKFN